MNRYALCDDQGERIKHLLLGKPGDVGVTARDNRRFVEAVLYRYRARIPWRDLPETVWRLEEHAQEAQPLGQERGMAAPLRAPGRRGRQRRYNDWHHHRARPPAPCRRTKKMTIK